MEQLTITAAAAERVAALLEQEDNPDLKLRVFVSGVGCSGFQYGFTFDEDTSVDDFSFSLNGITVLVDSMSYIYLSGASIDFTEDLEMSQFVINNPNATATATLWMWKLF